MLAALVEIPSENPPGDTEPIMDFLDEWLRQRGFNVERHAVLEPFTRQVGRGEVSNIIVRHRFGAEGPVVALNAPLDTLPAGSDWSRDPFTADVRDRRLYGRGARESKADVVAFIFAFEALVAQGGTRGQVELHFTADEESGGLLGPSFLLAQELSAPDAVIAAGTAHQVITGQQGLIQFEVVLRGKQAHASRPEDGASAIMAGLPILNALAAQQAAAHMPLTVSTIRGGRGVNLVADEVRFTIDQRIATGENAHDSADRLTKLIESVHTTPNVALECRRLLIAEPVEADANSERLAETVSACASVAMGRSIPIASAPVVSGARHYAKLGIPTVLYGVGPPVVAEGADFQGDEWVSLDEMERVTAGVALSVAAILNHA